MFLWEDWKKLADNLPGTANRSDSNPANVGIKRNHRALYKKPWAPLGKAMMPTTWRRISGIDSVLEHLC